MQLVRRLGRRRDDDLLGAATDVQRGLQRTDAWLAWLAEAELCAVEVGVSESLPRDVEKQRTGAKPWRLGETWCFLYLVIEVPVRTQP